MNLSIKHSDRFKPVDIGFLLFMFTVFLSPEIPVANQTIPAGIVGLLIWFIFSVFQLPIVRIARSYWFIFVCIFTNWTLIVSMQSLNSSIYSLQMSVYFLVGGLLLVAYAEARPFAFRRGLAFIAGLYAAALIISVWTGPFYKWQLLYYVRGDMLRAAGTSSDVNQAGGVAAVFTLLLVGSGRWRVGSISALGMVATASRSAGISLVVGAVTFLALLFMKGREKSSLVIAGGISATLAGAAIMAMVVTTGDLAGAFTPAEVMISSEERYNIWLSGLERWSEGSVFQALVGLGYHTASIFSSHNYFIELMIDIGLIGVVLFVLMIGVTFSYIRHSPGAVGALVVILTHNMTERFLQHPAMIVAYLLCVAAGRSLWAEISQRFQAEQAVDDLYGRRLLSE